MLRLPQENVPWLIAFVILTLAPQHAVCYYLMLKAGRIFAPDWAAQVAQAALLHAQVLAACWAIFRIYSAKRHSFYMFEYAIKQELQEKQQAMARTGMLADSGAVPPTSRFD